MPDTRVANIVFQKVLNVHATTGYRPAQAQEGPAGWRGGDTFLVFCLGVTKPFYKRESKFLNSRVLAGGFVMECAKKVLVLSIYKKVVEKLQYNKSLRSQTKVWKLAALPDTLYLHPNVQNHQLLVFPSH